MMKLLEGKNTWTTLDEAVKYETPWIKVTEHNVITPAGTRSIYGVVSFKNVAVGVLPLDAEKNTWLVGQWRYPLEQYSWEIPEGGAPKNEEPLEAAKRELKEETGLIASEYSELIRMHTSNSVSDEHAIIYVAKGLTQAESEPEDSEDLQVRKVPFEEAFQMVISGRITDSLSVAAILRAKLLIDKGEL
jgi:ADP-ribose pyrophosphatase